MLPVAISMVGTGAKLPTAAFLGWFGPRGLATIVFAVIVVEGAQLAGTETTLLAAYITVGLSVFAQGISAAPVAKRYARWYESHQPVPPDMESVPAGERRARGPADTPSSLG